jgi:anti-sigma B factor antagonist
MLPGVELTTEREDGVAVVVVNGSLDADNAPTFSDACGGLLANGEHNLVIDMSGVSVLDGTGLAALVELYKRVRIGPGDVRLCGLRTWVTVMFAMTRLNKVFDSFATREAAVASFAPAENA